MSGDVAVDAAPGGERKRTPRRTFAQVRQEAVKERDRQTAAFLNGYARCLEHGLSVNRRRHPEEIREPLIDALRGLASSIRAGLVDDGLPDAKVGRGR